MASRLIKEDRAARNERLKRAALKSLLLSPRSQKHLHSSLQTLGSQVDADLRDRITTIHLNAQTLETQTRTLKNRTASLSKTTRQWSGMAEGARSRLKEIGDIQNWAEMIEHELLVMEETMNIVYNDDALLQETAAEQGAHTLALRS
ncbi:GCN5-like protein 1-domain-containing protein [Peziza echinospora]|nr:GCN5-like protein 1-domain-containing protein [Peziza echinospora]